MGTLHGSISLIPEAFQFTENELPAESMLDGVDQGLLSHPLPMIGFAADPALVYESGFDAET